MNLARYKTAPPIAVRLSGELIWLNPLPRLHLQQAEAAAAALFRARECKPVGPVYEMARQAHILASALGCPCENVLGELQPDDLHTLWVCWAVHQSHVAFVDNPGAFREEVRKRVNDDVDVLRDGEAAYLAATPSDFYGKPVVDLTDAQVDYYTLARAAFTEFHLGERTKEVSRAWLQSPSV